MFSQCGWLWQETASHQKWMWRVWRSALHPTQCMELRTVCCGMALKRMGMLGVSVRKMKALNNKIETVTLIDKWDRMWHALHIKCMKLVVKYLFNRHFIWGVVLRSGKYSIQKEVKIRLHTLTPALDEVSGQPHDLPASPSERTLVPTSKNNVWSIENFCTVVSSHLVKSHSRKTLPYKTLHIFTKSTTTII